MLHTFVIDKDRKIGRLGCGADATKDCIAFVGARYNTSIMVPSHRTPGDVRQISVFRPLRSACFLWSAITAADANQAHTVHRVEQDMPCPYVAPCYTQQRTYATRQAATLHYHCHSPAVYEEDVLLPRDKRGQGETLCDQEKRGEPRHRGHSPRAVAGVSVNIVRVVLAPAQTGGGGRRCTD